MGYNATEVIVSGQDNLSQRLSLRDEHARNKGLQILEVDIL